LQLSHLDPVYVCQRFPGIAHTCEQFGIDITTDRIPVRPGAHYMLGGVVVDMAGRTSLPRLWGAGEVTSSGLHGANRLASNSLLEGLVYGALAGRGANAAALSEPDTFRAIPLEHPIDVSGDELLDLADIRNSLKSLMWRDAGVWRDGPRLASAIETIDVWSRYVLRGQFHDPVGWELQNMLTIARIMLASALQRTESRGVHLRNDYPQMDNDHWQGQILQSWGVEPRFVARGGVG
jgi:L-aspartate oxidase